MNNTPTPAGNVTVLWSINCSLTSNQMLKCGRKFVHLDNLSNTLNCQGNENRGPALSDAITSIPGRKFKSSQFWKS